MKWGEVFKRKREIPFMTKIYHEGLIVEDINILINYADQLQNLIDEVLGDCRLDTVIIPLGNERNKVLEYINKVRQSM